MGAPKDHGLVSNVPMGPAEHEMPSVSAKVLQSTDITTLHKGEQAGNGGTQPSRQTSHMDESSIPSALAPPVREIPDGWSPRRDVDMDNDLESGRPASKTPLPVLVNQVRGSSGDGGTDEPTEVFEPDSISRPFMNRFRLLAICLYQLGNGMNDSAPGALLPTIQS